MFDRFALTGYYTCACPAHLLMIELPILQTNVLLLSYREVLILGYCLGYYSGDKLKVQSNKPKAQRAAQLNTGAQF